MRSSAPAVAFRINNFDLLRLFAALQVLVFHTASRLEIPLGRGLSLIDAFPGVPIFFAISGFLIAAALERSDSITRYAANRLYRILPGLWCCVLLTLPVAMLCGIDVFTWQAPVWLAAQMGGLIYTPGFLKEFGIGSYNGSLWTIPVELQFYLVLPVLLFLLRRDATRTLRDQNAWLALIWIGFLVFALAVQHLMPAPTDNSAESSAGKLLRYSFLPHFHLFLTGVLMQRLQLWRSNWIAGKGLYWLAAYLILYYLLPVDPSTHVFKLVLLGVTAISCAYTAPGLAHRLLGGNDISYGVYIYHGLLINLFVATGTTGSFAIGAEVVVLSLLVGWLSWVLVEQPMLARKRGPAIHPIDQAPPTGSSFATDKASHLVP